MKRINSFIRSFLLIIFLVILNHKIYAQISGNELFEIIDLYVAEHFDVVLAKLSNLRFELKETTPDYSENNIDYKASFAMIQPYECFYYIPPHKLITTYSYIKFETQSRSSEKHVQIDFTLIMPSAQYVLQYKINELEKEIGPADNITHKNGGMSAEFRDKKEYYGKNVEDPSSLIIVRSRSFYSLKYYTLSTNCTSEYTNFEGTIAYTIPKYPVENPAEFFENIETNKDLISVPVKRQGNTYLVEITIGGKNLTYIIDSGASEMVIFSSFEKYLLDLGIIRNSDYLPSKTFILADGSEKIYRRVKLPVVRIGTIKVEDVEAAISEDNSSLLLGKSFLDKFKYWKINNEKLTLELQY